MTNSLLRRSQLLAILATTVCQTAQSQTFFQGVVLEDSSRVPVRRYPVALVRFLPRGEAVVARAKTDARGLFQLMTDKAGVYQLEFGDTLIGITYGPVDTVSADSTLLRHYVIRPPPDLSSRVLLEYHVEEPVTQLGARIWYPDDLRQRGVCGEVLASFVVDTLGRAEMATFRVLQSTDSLFSRAVRDGVANSRYKPARLHSRAVRQLVEQPFAFSMAEPRDISPVFPKRDSLTAEPYVPHPTCWSQPPSR